jgi:N-acyl amino acid synthase of PEP-CTERM/exosortase system
MIQQLGLSDLKSRRGRCAHGLVLRKALELRYQVYCLEYNFLSPDDYPEGVETDEHDDGAAHFYAFDRDDELVGYVRLVRADAEQAFPIQKHCRLTAVDFDLPAPSNAAEISRLMVRSDYRRRRGDRLSGVTAKQNNAAFAGERRHESPQILLSLPTNVRTQSGERHSPLVRSDGASPCALTSAPELCLQIDGS